jgi:hypothetical protein
MLAGFLPTSPPQIRPPGAHKVKRHKIVLLCLAAIYLSNRSASSLELVVWEYRDRPRLDASGPIHAGESIRYGSSIQA